jgi:hypothetical protein
LFARSDLPAPFDAGKEFTFIVPGHKEGGMLESRIW